MKNDLVHRIAVHESGHAVVGLSLGLPLVRVEIGYLGPYDDGVALGGTTFAARENDPRKLVADRPDAMGVTLWAGTSAERRIFRRYLPGSFEGDMNILRRGLQWLDGLTKEQMTRMRTYVARAEAAVIDHQDEICRVADALAEAGTLGVLQVRALL